MENVPCDPNRECKLRDKIGCGENIDHYWWPRSFYTGSLARAFREMGSEKRRVCMDIHNERHATQKPPEKPSVEDMRLAIRGIKRVEKKEEGWYGERT